MFDLNVLTSVVLALLLLCLGACLGWRLRAVLRDGALEMRARDADIDQLRAALADSQKRCAQQAEWLAAMPESEFEARGNGGAKAAM